MTCEAGDASFVFGETTVEDALANDVDGTAALNPQQRGRTDA